MKSLLIPAILAENDESFESKMRLAERFTDYVQVDFMDGRFVPGKTVGVESIAKVKSRLRLEAHLMVERPLDYLEALKNAEFERIYFHVEATDAPHQVISKALSLGLAVGAAINPATPFDILEALPNGVDRVLFVGVDLLRAGDHEFIPAVLGKIRAFKRHFSIPAAVDGGIKIENLRSILDAGADFVTVGGAIFDAGDPEAEYRSFLSVIERTISEAKLWNRKGG